LNVSPVGSPWHRPEKGGLIEPKRSPASVSTMTPDPESDSRGPAATRRRRFMETTTIPGSLRTMAEGLQVTRIGTEPCSSLVPASSGLQTTGTPRLPYSHHLLETFLLLESI
jgi:hypothetical protein